ncbi:MAG: protein phosphatase 2C family protein [Alkalicoccus sp.]|nr:MAG: protein phosphatase 2C family protein [Alkalicoccus sp.]
MIKSVDVVYEQGSNENNEDQYILNEKHGFFAVIDGATSLAKTGMPGLLASQTVRDSMAESTASPLAAFQQANAALSETAVAASEYLSVSATPKEERSTCGGTAVRFHEDALEYAHLGDCMLFLEYSDGTVRRVTFDHLSILDNLAIREAHHYRMKWLEEHGLPPGDEAKRMHKEVKEHISPTLLTNRRKLNESNGYGVFDGSKEAERFIESGTIPLINVSKVLLISDGLQYPVSPESDSDGWSQAAEHSFRHGVDSLLAAVNELEQSDPLCYKYPRLKPADDKTAVLITLK